MKKIGADLVDEHFYRPYEWFLSQGARYDNYDREGPKVFAGEYACHAKGKKWNHYYASLLEAAFMTGIERNADIVHMATYAPLFAHVEGWQWRPDLIWYDNLRSFRTVSWHVQQLYGQYRGKNTLTLTMDGKNVTGAEGQQGLFASAVSDDNKVYVKVVNTSEEAKSIELSFGGVSVSGVSSVKLSSDKLEEDNSLDVPDNIVPVTESLGGKGTSIKVKVEPLSFRIYILEK